MMSHRKLQVQSNLKKAISQVLAAQLADPRIVGLVSITQVQVSADFREATVMVSIMPDQYQSRSIHGLNSAAGRIASLVRQRVQMRTIPRLTFKLDQSLKKQAQVFDAIARGLEQAGPDSRMNDQSKQDNKQFEDEDSSIAEKQGK